MNDTQQNKCNAIIHSASAICAAIGAGMAQVPGSDSAIIMPIQVGMIISLGAVFDIELEVSTAKATLVTATATMVGRGLSQAVLGWIPGYGNVLNASTAFAITESIGWSIANDFAARKLQRRWG